MATPPSSAAVARFAPMIETRASRVVNGTVEQPVLSTDIPMVMAPTVEQLPDGGKRITYDLLISNEDYARLEATVLLTP